jgi:hypothetical protein
MFKDTEEHQIYLDSRENISRVSYLTVQGNSGSKIYFRCCNKEEMN